MMEWNKNATNMTIIDYNNDTRHSLVVYCRNTFVKSKIADSKFDSLPMCPRKVPQ